MNIPIEPFVWFTDFDTSIVGADICSKCRRSLEGECDVLMLFREHRNGAVDVARFHDGCAKELMDAGIITLEEG